MKIVQRLLVLFASLLLAASATAKPAALKAGVFDPPRAAPEFIAVSASKGGELKLANYRGKVVLLVFGFTQCPEVCPTTLATLAQARKQMGAQADAVQVVYVTVDPERDDIERIRQYLAAFDPSFVGGTARPPALEAVRKNYGVSAAKVPLSSGGYAMNHSTSIYLIDRAGLLRALMPYGHGAADFVHDLQALLAEK